MMSFLKRWPLKSIMRGSRGAVRWPHSLPERQITSLTQQNLKAQAAEKPLVYLGCESGKIGSENKKAQCWKHRAFLEISWLGWQAAARMKH
jgi:hypothetical protein